MVALSFSSELAYCDDFELREPAAPLGPRRELARKRELTGRQRLAQQTRYSRRPARRSVSARGIHRRGSRQAPAAL